jgi:hypothetical protein
LEAKPERQREPGKPRQRWRDNIRVNPKEMGSKGVDWIHMAQDRNKWWAHFKTIINSQVP